MKISALNIGMLSCDVIKKIMMLKVNLANYCKLKVDLAHNDGIYQWLWELNLQNLLVFEKYVITAKTCSDFLINNIETGLIIPYLSSLNIHQKKPKSITRQFVLFKIKTELDL